MVSDVQNKQFHWESVMSDILLQIIGGINSIGNQRKKCYQLLRVG